MKQLYILLFTFLFFNSQAQNLVPNGSFEQYVNCPTAFSQVTSHCVGWYQYSMGTSDYFNACGGPSVGVPVNNWGNEPAAHGNAYVGGYFYLPSGNTKEYVATTITPLTIGAAYEVSMSVSLGDICAWACNDFGVFFYDLGGPAAVAAQVLPVTPQIDYSSNGVITNKTGWTRLTASFVADSAYDNIIIGGFKNQTTITTQAVTGTGTYAYYYIDSVVIKLATNVLINYTNTQLCAGATINVPYTVQNITFVPGNTFTLQLSDAAGSFASPVNIGSVTSTTGGNVQGTIPAGTPPGTGYRLRLVSSNPSHISNMTGNITISAAPTGITVGSNSPVCAGGTINLTSSSTTPGVSYSWSGPVSYSAATQNATRTGVTMPMSGFYTVTVNNNGCTAKDSVLVNVNPALNINATSNSPICTGGTLTLNIFGGGGGGTTYNWYGPNSFTANTQNATIPGVTAAAAGIYMAVANNGPCTDTAYTTVVLGTPPAAPVAGSNSPVCSGNSINLTASSTTPGVTYSWTGPGGYNTMVQNPTRTNATLAMSGTYTVTAAVGACPAAPVTTQVVVNQTPTAPTATNNGPLCAGAALDLFASSQAGATYQWNGPAGYNSTVQNPILLGTTTANAGAYTVTRTMNGCTSAPGTTLAVINNSVNPAIAVFPSPNDTICPGQAVIFVASPNNGGTTPQYQWKKNGNNIPGAIAATYNTSAINSGDFFSCELVSSAACAFPQTVQSNNLLMTVEPPQPCAVSITANPGLVLSPWELVTFTATPVKGGLLPVYQWLRNGKPVIGAVSNTWGANNLNSNDTISVVLFSTDPCAVPNTDTSNYLVVNIKTGINDISNDNQLIVYPNPNNGTFVVKGHLPPSAAINITNAIGQPIHYNRNTINNEHSIQLGTHIANGLYLLHITTGESKQVLKFTLDR